MTQATKSDVSDPRTVKCGHVPCTCLVHSAAVFCSEECKDDAESGANQNCGCGHVECAHALAAAKRSA